MPKSKRRIPNKHREVNACFFCDRDSKGNLITDKKAFRMISSYEPCPHCKQVWAEKVTCIITTTQTPKSKLKPISQINGLPVYPVGVMVFDPDTYNKLFTTPAKKGDIVFIDEPYIEQLKDAVTTLQKEPL